MPHFLCSGALRTYLTAQVGTFRVGAPPDAQAALIIPFNQEGDKEHVSMSAGGETRKGPTPKVGNRANRDNVWALGAVESIPPFERPIGLGDAWRPHRAIASDSAVAITIATR